MKYILSGLACVILGALVYWGILFFKALKNPDVQIASNLRMSVKRFRQYQKLYDEYFEFMQIHGANSVASQQKFIEIFKQIKNPNEWRRYQQYRASQSSIYDQMMKEYLCDSDDKQLAD